jgi:hypothetical protein
VVDDLAFLRTDRAEAFHQVFEHALLTDKHAATADLASAGLAGGNFADANLEMHSLALRSIDRAPRRESVRGLRATNGTLVARVLVRNRQHHHTAEEFPMAVLANKGIVVVPACAKTSRLLAPRASLSIRPFGVSDTYAVPSRAMVMSLQTEAGAGKGYDISLSLVASGSHRRTGRFRG